MILRNDLVGFHEIESSVSIFGSSDIGSKIWCSGVSVLNHLLVLFVCVLVVLG